MHTMKDKLKKALRGQRLVRKILSENVCPTRRGAEKLVRAMLKATK